MQSNIGWRCVFPHCRGECVAIMRKVHVTVVCLLGKTCWLTTSVFSPLLHWLPNSGCRRAGENDHTHHQNQADCVAAFAKKKKKWVRGREMPALPVHWLPVICLLLHGFALVCGFFLACKDYRGRFDEPTLLFIYLFFDWNSVWAHQFHSFRPWFSP